MIQNFAACIRSPYLSTVLSMPSHDPTGKAKSANLGCDELGQSQIVPSMFTSTILGKMSCLLPRCFDGCSQNMCNENTSGLYVACRD